MTSFVKLSTYVFSAAAAFQVVIAAVPDVEARKDYPQVTGGPGLPTPESLGLTSEDLYTRVPSSEELKQLAAPPFHLQCGQVPPACSVADAVACANFLIAAGGKTCNVNGDNTKFCSAGSCNWYGSNISGGGSASSSCSDVAAGGNQVIDSCQGFGSVDGSNAARGNGDLIVTIRAV